MHDIKHIRKEVITIINFKRLNDSELVEFYKYRVQISNGKTDSLLVNRYLENCQELSQIEIAFLPFSIINEISRRWYTEKAKIYKE